MKFNQYLLFILNLVMSCHEPTVKSKPAPVKVRDTTNAISHPDPSHEIVSAVIWKTHLKDTTYVVGSFILFLQPDDNRYAELEKNDEGEVGNGDADFGAGIRGTQDRLKGNNRHKGIKVLISSNRFICIRDCKDGPLIIDRDSVNYGFIISAKGRTIANTYNSVHSGDYLGEIDEYFALH